MELKLQMNKLQFSTLQSSNRTFMELKYEAKDCKLVSDVVNLVIKKKE